MPRRRNIDHRLDFEIHVDDSCRIPQASNQESARFDATESQESIMTRMSSAHELNTDFDGPDATIMNQFETEDMEFANRRESDLSNASFQSDRRPPSRPQSDFGQSASNLQADVSGAKQSIQSSTKRVSAGDSSSQRDPEEDVFSDNSPRSSTGSNVDADHSKQPQTNARRMTGESKISEMQPYDPDEEFIPTVRETPRLPFRSPSSVKAMQMNSPPPSVTGSGRSNRRTHRSSISRMGTPVLSTQMSPRKTPPRFKRSTPPLVLLHVTLLPLTWPWGDLMHNARPSELSEAGRNLREAWKQLHARLGDTVSDRGVLLPHPQNDFEVLEERLLEALELPQRRRARILECGHYLGPANETTTSEDEVTSDEEGFENKTSEEEKRHWCPTCQSDIRYDSLGEGKIFRIKVYASNGLMKAGAWDACWKEMERVDVELEPIVDPSLVDELERIAATQEREAIEAEIAASTHLSSGANDGGDEFSHEKDFDESLTAEDSRLYEERMREVWGQPEVGDEGVAEEAEPEQAENHQQVPQTWSKDAAREEVKDDSWTKNFRYGLRDVVQLIVLVLCVLLLQYLGIGFDKKGGKLARPMEEESVARTRQVQEDLQEPVTDSAASRASAGVSVVVVEDTTTTTTASPMTVEEQVRYAACTSALDVARASLAVAGSSKIETATVTVTETVRVVTTSTETTAVAETETETAAEAGMPLGSVRAEEGGEDDKESVGAEATMKKNVEEPAEGLTDRVETEEKPSLVGTDDGSGDEKTKKKKKLNVDVEEDNKPNTADSKEADSSVVNDKKMDFFSTGNEKTVLPMTGDKETKPSLVGDAKVEL